MEKSIYAEYVQKFFPQFISSVVERLNGQNTNQLTYLYKQLLDVEFSADGRWASILAEYTRVAADVVALDSELPLKSRDAIETASGDIPKIGMKVYLTEKQMKDIDAMIALNMPLQRVLTKILADAPRCIEAVYERIEDIFLSELSSGVGVSEKNNGTGIRIDMNYKAANQFHAATTWTGNPTTALPLDDIQAVFDKAMEDNNVITDVYADDKWLKAFYSNSQVRAQYAFISGVSVAAGGAVPVLGFDQAAQVLKSKWDINLHRVARKIKTELNGTKNNHNPWAEGVAAFTCDAKLGKLVWTNVAEATRPVKDVDYQNADEFILVSKYSTNDPLREFTSSQAMAIPVLDNVDRIYTLNQAAQG